MSLLKFGQAVDLSLGVTRWKFFIFIFKKAKILAQPSKYLLNFLQRINQFVSQIFKFLCCAGIVLYVREAEAIWKDDCSSNFLLKILIMKSLMLDYYFKKSGPPISSDVTLSGEALGL